MAISKAITVVLAAGLGQLVMQTHARPEPETAFAGREVLRVHGR